MACNLWLHCSAAFPFQVPSMPRILLSHSKPNRHSPPPCFPALAIPILCKTLLLQAPIFQMLNVPWEFQQCTRLHAGSPDVISELTFVLPHSFPEGSWEPSRILAQPPGNKQTGYKEKRTVALNLMRLFPLGRSRSLHCNGKVDIQCPQPPLK